MIQWYPVPLVPSWWWHLSTQTNWSVSSVQSPGNHLLRWASRTASLGCKQTASPAAWSAARQLDTTGYNFSNAGKPWRKSQPLSRKMPKHAQTPSVGHSTVLWVCLKMMLPSGNSAADHRCLLLLPLSWTLRTVARLCCSMLDLEGLTEQNL